MSVQEKLAALAAAAGVSTSSVVVTIGDVGQEFKIKRLSYLESQSVMSLMFNIDDEGGVKFDRSRMADRNVALLAACVLDDDNKAAFTQKTAAELDPQVGMQLLVAINRLNGFTKNPVEDAAKNSSTTPNAAT
jgi:hypothetical protein